MAAKKTTNKSPAAELRSLIEKFGPKDQKLIRSVRAALRKRFPTANELAYDYGSSLVVSYSPTERAIEAIFAFAARADGVRLYFVNGHKLADPKEILLGSGRQTRFIYLESARQLAHPDVKKLIAGTLELAPISLPRKGGGELFMKSTAAKRRASPKKAK